MDSYIRILEHEIDRYTHILQRFGAGSTGTQRRGVPESTAKIYIYIYIYIYTPIV